VSSNDEAGLGFREGSEKGISGLDCGDSGFGVADDTAGERAGMEDPYHKQLVV
jgi:hypothetical protein